MDCYNARWICAPEFLREPIDVFYPEEQPQDGIEEQHPSELYNYHMLVRRTFLVDRLDTEWRLQITADDYYKLYINGQYVGQGPAPAYAEHYWYNVYNITSFLRPGVNVIAVHCYYQGLINRVWNSGDLRQGLWASLYCGSERVLGTDASWKYQRTREYGDGGLIGYKTQYLENIDARLQYKGWKLPEYDDSEWSSLCIKEEDDHQLFPQETEVVDCYEMAPVMAEPIADDEWLYDFGEEITGGLRITAQGHKGEQVRIRLAEELEDGYPRWQMRCNCDYEETWTLSGEEDVLENYDYKAFRYVAVRSEQHYPITAVVRHYPFKDVTQLVSCKDPQLLAIWNLCSRSVQMGTQEVFVDCPSREKGQYLGDMIITGRCHGYLTGDYAMFRKGLYDFARSAKVDKGLMAVAPGSLMQEIADYSLMYPYLLVQYYRCTGDRSVLEELYPIAKDCIDAFAGYKREDGLLEAVTGKWNLVDWPANLRDDYDFPVTKPIGPGCHNVINAFYYGGLYYLAELEKILGIDAKTDDQADGVRKAYQKAFYNEDMQLFVDREGSLHASLHSNGLALFFGLQPSEAEGPIANHILEKGLCCGVYTAYYVLHGLASIGKYQEMYDLMVNEGEHSWMQMLREGATTCYEAWGKEQKWNTSLCHPWGSAPILLILEDLMGLRWEGENPVWESKLDLGIQVKMARKR